MFVVNLLKEVMQMQDALQRFMARVDQSGGENACHPWTGAIDKNTGYGCLKVNGKKYNAHRYLAMLLEWEISGKDVRHKVCHNRVCCNRKHLEPGTRAENMNDSRLLGTFPLIGSKHGNAKLTEDVVQEIRRRGRLEHTTQLAYLYNVSRATIRNVLQGKSWTHV